MEFEWLKTYKNFSRFWGQGFLMIYEGSSKAFFLFSWDDFR